VTVRKCPAASPCCIATPFGRPVEPEV